MKSERPIYLNHAGTSWPKPPTVLEAAHSVLHSDSTNWGPLFDAAHRKVADFFHVDAARLLFTPSCTSAICVAMTDLDWKRGDRIVTSMYEHHALYRSCLKLSDRGVEISVLPEKRVKSEVVELIDIKALSSELESGNVRLLALTAACNVTGQLLPISEAIELAHRYDVLVLIDGAQIAGWRDLDLVELKADLFAFAGHKAPQAPWGIGGLYVRPGVPMNCSHATCGRTESDCATQSTPMPGYCDVGSVNLSALAGLGAATTWLNAPQRTSRLAEARNLASEFTDGIRNIPGLAIHGDVPMSQKVPTVAFTYESQAPVAIAKHLAEHGLIASGGLQCAPQAHIALGTEPEGVVRVSFGPGNLASDADSAARVIQSVLG